MVSDLNNTLSVCVLGSSSSGNSTLVQSGESALLVDCGFTPAYMKMNLKHCGLEIEDLTGVLITHVHSDHVNEWFVKKLIKARIPIHCPPEIELHLQARYDSLARASHLGLLKVFRKSELELGGFLVENFEVPHDSPGGCFGYSISLAVGGKTTRVTIATDMAHPTEAASQHFADSDLLVIESNHDVDMLENSGRPFWLKRRIREKGHLSNDQCAEILLSVFDRSTKLPQTIMLAHVSQECNTNALAVECAKTAIDGEGINSISILETHPFGPSQTATF
jgi:phosphoribosyl 1,2-cyclic phosphodiesterase